MKEIIDLEEKNGAYSLKATTPIYNLIKPSQDDFYNVDDMNTNTDIIEGELDKQAKQITDCLGEIGKVKEQIAGIDVTTDVEDVVTRLVNSDRTTPLDTLINNVKTVITNSITTAKDAILSRITEINNAIIAHVSSAVNTARDVVTNHITSQHTTTKGHVTTKATEINNNTNTARDNIKSHVTTEKTNIVNVINAKAGIGKYWKSSATARATILNSEISDKYIANQETILGSFLCTVDGYIRVKASLKALEGNALLNVIGSMSDRTSGVGGKDFSTNILLVPNNRDVLAHSQLAVGTKILTYNSGHTIEGFRLLGTRTSASYGTYYSDLQVSKGQLLVFTLKGNGLAGAYCNSLQICYDEVTA